MPSPTARLPPTPKPAIGAPACEQVGDAELVDVAADEHLGLVQTGLVQHPPHVLAVGEKVAAVEADRDQLVAQTRPGVQGHRDGGLDRGVDVVGVEQKRVAIQVLGHRAEGFLLGREDLHQGVGDGAAGGQIEDLGPRHEGGAGATADEGRAGRQVRIVGTAKPEVGHLPAGRRIDQARRLRRDQRRDADGPQQTRFQQQRLAEGRGHSQQGLVGEGDGPLGHGQDLAGEPEVAQLVEERRVVGFDPGQVGEILLRVAEVADEGQRRLQSRGQEIRSPERRRAGVEVECRRRVLPRPPAHVRGVEVIEIDEETGGRLGFGPHRLHVPRALSGHVATQRRSPTRCVCRTASHGTGTSVVSNEDGADSFAGGCRATGALC